MEACKQHPHTNTVAVAGAADAHVLGAVVKAEKINLVKPILVGEMCIRDSILVGAIRNWNWLCDPTGAPDSQRYGRKSRRAIFFLLGVLLIVVGIWGFVLKLK